MSVLFRGAWLVLAILILNGCSSLPVRTSSRKGLLDRLSEYSVVSAPSERRGAVAVKEAENESLTEVRLKRLKTAVDDWVWPLKKVNVTSGFGYRKSGFHDGIDLKAQSGTRLYAVADGKVLYAGNRLAGYGNLIVLRHGDDLSSIYAHNSKMFVKKGQQVKQGQLIGYTGATGRVSGPHLHFEIRSGLVSVDPTALLGKRTLIERDKRRSVASAK